MLQAKQALNDKFKNANRAIAVIVACLAFIEIVVGGVTYSFLVSGSVKGVGSWWVGFTVFLLVIFALVAVERHWLTSFTGCCNGFAIIGTIVGLVGVVIGIAGSIYDGLSYDILYANQCCLNPSTGQYFGDLTYQLNTDYCASLNVDGVTPSTCVCLVLGICTVFDIRDYSAHDCNAVLGNTVGSGEHYFTDIVHSSTILCALTTVLVFFYSIILCAKGCSSQSIQFVNVSDPKSGNQFELVPSDDAPSVVVDA